MGTRTRAATATTKVVVEAAYAAFAARDIPRLLDLLDPDVVWGQARNPSIPSSGTWQGIAGVTEWLRIGNETEEVLQLEPRHLLVDGDMAAVIRGTTVRVRATGIAYTTDFVHLVTVTDGKVTRFQELFDTALAAAAFEGRSA